MIFIDVQILKRNHFGIVKSISLVIRWFNSLKYSFFSVCVLFIFRIFFFFFVFFGAHCKSMTIKTGMRTSDEIWSIFCCSHSNEFDLRTLDTRQPKRKKKVSFVSAMQTVIINQNSPFRKWKQSSILLTAAIYR